MLGWRLPSRVGTRSLTKVEHREVDLLPATGPLARDERHRDAVRGEHARHDVGNRHAEPERRAVGRARDAHQAALGLHHGVVARLVPSRTGLAEPRDGAVDQAGIPRGDRVVVESLSGQRARAEVFDEHVALRDETIEDRATVRMFEVERDALLVPVDAHEIGALALDKRRAPRPGIVAPAGPLDLDDPGPHVGQLHRAIGTRQHPGEVDHGDASQRALRAVARLGRGFAHRHRVIIVYCVFGVRAAFAGRAGDPAGVRYTQPLRRVPPSR